MYIEVKKNPLPKQKPVDPGTLGFGKVFTDHMLLIDHSPDNGWHSPRIVPYGPLSLDPATCSLHYGQLIFEGLKAYRTRADKVVLFRPEQNIRRLNTSAQRLCIPTIDEKLALEGIRELVRLDSDWIPTMPGTSLYIRPFVMGTDPFLGIRPSDSYVFCTILAPSGPYFKGGLAPVRIYVEEKYVRAVRGGVGFAKNAGNYAASLASQTEAQKEGFAQVLWLDGIERKYVEEVGAMNIFFVIDGQVITPEISGSILPGITRASVIELLKSWGVPVREGKISIGEIASAHSSGRLEEVFGTGTAAVISPVSELKWGDNPMKISDTAGSLSQKLYDTLTGIQMQEIPDPFGWMYEV